MADRKCTKCKGSGKAKEDPRFEYVSSKGKPMERVCNDCQGTGKELTPAEWHKALAKAKRSGLHDLFCKPKAGAPKPPTVTSLKRTIPGAVDALRAFLAGHYDDAETDVKKGNFEFRDADDESLLAAWGTRKVRKAAGSTGVLVYMDDNYALAFDGKRWDSID